MTISSVSEAVFDDITGNYVKPTPAANEFFDQLDPMPSWVMEHLAEKYGLGAKECHSAGFKWAPKYRGGRLAMPIKSRMQSRVGWGFRALAPGHGPKAINMMTLGDSVCMSWYPMQNWITTTMYNLRSPLIVVEDQLSALKVSRYAHAVALLGTNMSESKAAEICLVKASRVIIALDADATAKSAQIVQKYAGLIDGLSFVELQKDLKDCEPSAIQKVLKL